MKKKKLEIWILCMNDRMKREKRRMFLVWNEKRKKSLDDDYGEWKNGWWKKKKTRSTKPFFALFSSWKTKASKPRNLILVLVFLMNGKAWESHQFIDGDGQHQRKKKILIKKTPKTTANFNQKDEKGKMFLFFCGGKSAKFGQKEGGCVLVIFWENF